MSKGKFGSIKGHSIDDLTLEKMLFHDFSIQKTQPTMRDLTDLKSCCDKQLENVCVVVEKIEDSERWCVWSLIKVTQRLEHYANARHGVSERHNSGCCNPTIGLDQGLVLVGERNMSKSCFILENMENEDCRCNNIDSATLENHFKKCQRS